MNLEKSNEVKDIAIKLDKIRKNNPKDYIYLKAWIHRLTQKSKNAEAGRMEAQGSKNVS